MNLEELIETKYKESVQGIDEQILLDHKEWYDYVECLPKHLRVVYTVSILDQQVFNGGFHQYFFNGYGLFGYLTLDALEEIKATDTKNLFEKVLSEINYENNSVKEFRRKVFDKELSKISNFEDALSDFLDDCDTEYYDTEEDLQQQLGMYLESLS